MSKTIGILGGMGSLATAYIFKKIIMLTDAKTDQDHINIVLYNNPSIPNRTDYILGKGENPLTYLVESAKKLESMGADFLIMPCNTAHYFYKDIISSIKIPFINMVEKTVIHLINAYPNEKTVGLLATQGTYKSEMYTNLLKNYNISTVIPSEHNQKFISNLINDIKVGNININLMKYYNILSEMQSQGAKKIILGCTEVSVAHEMFNIVGDYIDSSEILAINAVIYAGKKIRTS